MPAPFVGTQSSLLAILISEDERYWEGDNVIVVIQRDLKVPLNCDVK